MSEIDELREQVERYKKPWLEGAKLWLEAQHSDLIAERDQLRAEVESLKQGMRDTAEPNHKDCQFSARDIAELFCHEAATTSWDVDQWTRIIEGYVAKEKTQLRAALAAAKEDTAQLAGVIDRLWNHNEAVRAAVIKHYGLHHSDRVIAAIDAARKAQP